MDVKQDRDAIVALLAIGAAMADPEMAAKLEFTGVPKKQRTLRVFATAVKVLQSRPSPDSPEFANAMTDLSTILGKLNIELPRGVKLKDCIVNTANEWGVAARALTWARSNFETFLIPKGTRAEVIAKFVEQGFNDEDELRYRSE